MRAEAADQLQRNLSNRLVEQMVTIRTSSLLQRLLAGMALIDVPATEQQAVLDELMRSRSNA